MCGKKAGLWLAPLLLCILKMNINGLLFLSNGIIGMASFWGRLLMEGAEQEALINS